MKKTKEKIITISLVEEEPISHIYKVMLNRKRKFLINVKIEDKKKKVK